MNQVVQMQKPAIDLAKVEQVLIKGDLATLNEAQRLDYYKSVCDSVGLNWLTKPFEYIPLNGKLVLYATKGCAEQLRAVHNISIKITDRQTLEGVYIVTAAAQRPDGRIDESTGAVTTVGLKGEALANAMMKAETKAKRRVTLSVCGLNMLDETEVESIPPGRVAPVQPSVGDGSTTADPDKFPSGQHAGKRYHELKDWELRAWLERAQLKASPEHWEMRMIEKVRGYLDTLNQMGPGEELPEPGSDIEDAPREKPKCTCGSGLVLSERKGVYYCANFKDASYQHIRSIPKAEYEAS